MEADELGKGGWRSLIMAGTDMTTSARDGDWARLLPAVILMEPQMGENIGASARAMKNCGLECMHIVNPRDGWPNPAAEAMASGGSDILDHAGLHQTLDEAAAPYTMIGATTARKRGMTKPALTPDEAARRMAEHARSGGKTALLFGPERAGLGNDAVAVADFIITVPLNPEFASLNLGQAVLLMGWACRRELMADAPPVMAEPPESPPAAAGEKAYLFTTLEKHLSEGGFFTSPDMQPVVMRNIMALFQRADLTEQDVRTLHGIIKSLRRSGDAQA